MVFVYKKTDISFKNPVSLENAVLYKTLWNKAQGVEHVLNNFIANNLMFEYEEFETKQHFYNALHELRKFRHNLKLRGEFKQ